MFEITEFEGRVIDAIIDSEYGEDFNDAVWTFSVRVKEKTGNQIKGALGSLVKKGLVSCWDYEPGEPVAQLTEVGIALYKERNPEKAKAIDATFKRVAKGGV